MSPTTLYLRDLKGNIVPIEVDVAADSVDIGEKVKAALAAHEDENVTPTIEAFPPLPHVSASIRGPINSAQRTGVAPTERNTTEVPSLNDVEKIQKLEETRFDVRRWLSTSDAGNAELHAERSAPIVADNESSFKDTQSVPRPGKDVVTAGQGNQETEHTTSRAFPLIPEGTDPESGEREIRGVTDEDFFRSASELADQGEEPYPHQFVSRSPPTETMRIEPRRADSTSNANMVTHQKKYAEWDAYSRTATVGSKKTVDSIYDGSSIKELSLSDNKSRDRGATLSDKIKSIMPRRSSSKLGNKKDHSPPKSPAEESFADSQHKRGISVTSLMPPESDSIPAYFTNSNTDNSGYLKTHDRRFSENADTTGASSPLHRLKRSFSKGEKRKSFTEHHSTPHIVGLMRREGGPPVSTALVSPLHEQHQGFELSAPPPAVENEDIDDDDEEENDEDVHVGSSTMIERFKSSSEDLSLVPITPDLNGFRDHALCLNPRMEIFLADRIAHEQVRRYKELVSHRVRHANEVFRGTCASESQCLAQGGQPTYLPARFNNKGEKTQIFFIRKHPDSAEAEANGATVATFQHGIPEPPVCQLPATFECSLCFKERKAVNKPSDWTKHVHEDLQPFTCTFQMCNTEKKSFKRKADWVRHENECHRHLEEWRCNYAECQHVCYRSDNFSQHLIREHKVADWKNKTRGSTNSKFRAPTASQNGDEDEPMAMLHRICRSTSKAQSESEPCAFCGLRSSTWKKHQVHLSKHMESIAMPVLTLVDQHDGSKDTVISPIKREQGHPIARSNTISEMADSQSLTPYSTNGSNFHPTSSASQSPMGLPPLPPTERQFARYLADPITFMTGLPNNQSALAGPHFTQHETATSMGGGSYGPYGYGPSTMGILDSAGYNQAYATSPNDASSIYDAHGPVEFAAVNSRTTSTYPPASVRKSPAHSQLQPPTSFAMSNQASSQGYVSSPHSSRSYPHSTSASPHQMRASPMHNQLEIPRSQGAGEQMAQYSTGDFPNTYAFTEQQGTMQSPLETELYPETFQQSIEAHDYLASTTALGYDNTTATSMPSGPGPYDQPEYGNYGQQAVAARQSQPYQY